MIHEQTANLQRYLINTVALARCCATGMKPNRLNGFLAAGISIWKTLQTVGWCSSFKSPR